ncbi:hypothetical protein ABZU45_42055, partial [Streptomyces avermitilis]|uniref:hypothetical protein n=1 Tax=Streptomyces avermitilis TaxID=33903 RepID=UPI0033AB6743
MLQQLHAMHTPEAAAYGGIEKHLLVQGAADVTCAIDPIHNRLTQRTKVNGACATTCTRSPTSSRASDHGGGKQRCLVSAGERGVVRAAARRRRASTR